MNKDQKEEIKEENIKEQEVQAEVKNEVENTQKAEEKIEQKNEMKDGTDIFDDDAVMELQETGEEEKAEDIKPKKEKKEKKSKKGKKKKKKKRDIKKVINGRAYIQATYNNTIITLTDQNGDTLLVGSAGQMGFKGPKKSTPYAASIIVRHIIARVREYGLQNVAVYVKGVGAGRESAVRALNANGLNILSIKDQTPIPHNGCRSKKPRRV